MNKGRQRIVEINPFDNEMLKLVKKYDKENDTYHLDTIKTIVGDMDSKYYEVMKMTLPVTYSVFAHYEKNGLKDVCLTYSEKDLKTFRMYLNDKNFGICYDLADYAFKSEAMSEVIVLVDKNNHRIINDLLDNRYIPLFDDNSNEDLVPLVKDNEFEKEYKNVR